MGFPMDLEPVKCRAPRLLPSKVNPGTSSACCCCRHRCHKRRVLWYRLDVFSSGSSRKFPDTWDWLERRLRFDLCCEVNERVTANGSLRCILVAFPVHKMLFPPSYPEANETRSGGIKPRTFRQIYSMLMFDICRAQVCTDIDQR